MKDAWNVKLPSQRLSLLSDVEDGDRDSINVLFPSQNGINVC
jgi:hypothetical protein